MKNKRWKTSDETVSSLYYHILWCVKYKRELLVDDVKKRLEDLLYEKSREIDITIVSIEIMPECVHLFVKANPEDSPHFIVQQFKGATSKVLREEFIQLKTKIPTLWTRNYYVSSSGILNEAEINTYLESQKNK
ncbi:MAG: IS200/IS605 family transposase [Sphaerochaetaceae bacterium]|nr:IS200/IS605 family transposase [Sphaerochaetaceae bacterium]MDC7236382.1 IS200/IS605 family transposase [Sphaerochaetaceae bacterium]MDC7251064.1 IS200/IS605 family transposase [Sphaerochaetaceae bacterium]